MKVLGVSGSPLPDSNTDRALKVALEATGLETEFIKLVDYNIKPCIACLKCVDTNVCAIKDDGIMLAEKAREADALIIAGFTPYSTLDSLTKAFIERLYPLRHRYGLMQGKPGGAIMTCAIPDTNEMMPQACDNGINAIMFYMMEEGMNFIGGVKVLGNVPCVSCGIGDECATSGLKMIYGPAATLDSVGINCFEEQPESMLAAKELGENIAAALKL
ncbi:flavodoxin family protein [Methanolobus sp. ZRKC3]|uniref:flavodoxin family protein n=1 Tax=Methanolobus sp. ZRKC3 TaxID=3125786 RepID=UPI0032463EA0